MDLVAFTEYLIKELVANPDLVSVKDMNTEDEMTIQVLVSSDDMGRVIGKSGSTINAVRTIVQSAARLNDINKVNVNIDSF